MTLRTYLRFLRPVRSSLVIALYTGIAASFGHSMFRLPGVTSLFLALSTALPLMIGIAVAGAAHEPMHRAFFLLLPDGPRHLRNATLLAVAVFACAVTCAVAYVEPSVPPLATLGLAAGLIAVLCLDRHQRLAGMAGWTGALWGWILFSLTAGERLRPAMIAAPWVFLLGGMALTAVSLVEGFSRRHLRQRAETLFVSFQSRVFSYLFNPHLMARQIDEMALYQGRRTKIGFPPGRDWPVQSVGSSTRAWMQVVWHAFAGRRRRGNFLALQLSMVAPVIAGGLVFPLATGFAMGRLHTLSDYWQSLAAMAAPENLLPTSKAADSMWIVGGVMQAGAAAFSLLLTISPQLAYPISRERLTRVVFGLSLVQLAVALALPAAAIFFLSLCGQIASGRFWPGFGLPSIAALDLALAVGLPLLACAGAFRRPVMRMLWTVPIGFALLIAIILRGQWMPHVLTFSGIVATALVASANVGLLWLCLQHRYRTCDLLFDPGLFNTRLHT